MTGNRQANNAAVIIKNRFHLAAIGDESKGKLFIVRIKKGPRTNVGVRSAGVDKRKSGHLT